MEKNHPSLCRAMKGTTSDVLFLESFPIGAGESIARASAPRTPRTRGPYNNRNEIVGTTNMPVGVTAWACSEAKVLQPSGGGRLFLGMYLATVICSTS